MSFAEIKQIVAQRVTNAIKVIAIYETKTHVVCDSMVRVVHQGAKVTNDSNKKRKWENDHGGSPSQQQNKRHNMIRAHAAGPSNKKEYTRSLPMCDKCKLHHTGPFTVKCGKCKRICHMTKFCGSLVLATTQRAPVANKKAAVTCH
ncbi:hypothetical protein Tco_0350687, partial [Tanacetum coccineum]